MTPTCPHCASKPRTGSSGYIGPTCGASACQEAEYHANRERNAHRKNHKNRRP